LVERPVVVLPDPLGVGELVPRRCDPHRLVTLLEVVRELAMRHQMEGADLHLNPLASAATGCSADRAGAGDPDRARGPTRPRAWTRSTRSRRSTCAAARGARTASPRHRARRRPDP